MIIIEIEIKSKNGFKKFFRKAHNKVDDVFFLIILKIPERFIPSFIMEWVDRYTNKRIDELKHQQIKARWKKMHLEKALEEIHKDKAPTEE